MIHLAQKISKIILFAALLPVSLAAVFGLPSFAGAATCTNICYVSTDQTTDYYADGSNDEITINDAITRVALYGNASSPGVVHLKAGTYKILNQVLLKSYVTLEGNGKANTIIQLQLGAPNVDRSGVANIPDGTQNATIQDLTLDAHFDLLTWADYPSTPQANWNTVQMDGDNSTLKNLNLLNSRNEAVRSKEAGGRNIMQNLYMTPIGHSCYYFYSADANASFDAENTTCWGNGNAGVRLEEVNNVHINHMTMNQANNLAIYILSKGGSRGVHDVLVENLLAYDPHGQQVAGIMVVAQGTTGPIYNIVFKNVALHMNQLDVGRADYEESPPGGVAFIHNADNVTFENVAFYDSYADGIVAQTDSYMTGSSHITVKNSIFSNLNGVVFREPKGNIAWNISYNDWFNMAGSYTGNVTLGANNIQVDPLFVSPSTYDFHLKSQYGRWNGSSWVTDSVTSSAIGAGDPATIITNCPSWGCPSVVEMGAYGNTVEASKSNSGGTPTPTPRAVQFSPKAV